MNKEKQCYFCGEEVSSKGYMERCGHNIIEICDSCAKNKNKKNKGDE